MTRTDVEAWVDEYVAAWRAPGTARLTEIFSDTIVYRVSPWKEPIRGLPDLAIFWEAGRAGPEEAFTIQREVVAVDHKTAVVRLAVEYAHDTPPKWRDLWILQFDAAGRCQHFEEWPFAEGQFDGQHQAKSG